VTLELRARAASATLVLGFNPHQRRGPDGRWIKLADHEKMPRRRKGAPAAVPEPPPAPEPPPPPTPAQKAKKPKPKRPPITAPVAKRSRALKASVASGVRGEEPIGNGKMGEVKLVSLEDGTSAIYKRALGEIEMPGDREPWSTKDQSDAEQASSLVADALGVRAPAVHRASDDEIYMERMPGDVAWRAFPDGPPEELMASDQAVRMGVLDVLLDNPDRHSGNWMVDDQGNIQAIDHGFSFMNTHGFSRSDATRSEFASRYFVNEDGSYVQNNILSTRDVERLYAAVESIRPQLAAMGRPFWRDVLHLRIDKLAQGAREDNPHHF
jgi:hypothetical protein